MNGDRLAVSPMRTTHMRQTFSLHAIRLAKDWDDDPFTASLPFDIAEGVRIESLSNQLLAGTFDLIKERKGSDAVEGLQAVQHALVHRYEPKPLFDAENNWIGEEIFVRQSSELVYNLAACLRLIRPMRESALLMQGAVRDDGTFDVERFDHPLEFHEVPEVQKFFALRNRDAEELRAIAPHFLRAMGRDYWKFRMAVQFHELGHFQPLHWKARYTLWASAIESIYTSNSPNHQGSLVAKERIKWFLGADTSIYDPGDISQLLPKTTIAVRDVVDRLYEVRNYVAHGDKIPDEFFSNSLRRSFNGPINEIEVLMEASSFIIRSSLLKILRDNLLEHFAGADTAERYFGGFGLTKAELKKKLKNSVP